MKIVTNRCYGGFGLSAIGQKGYLKLKDQEAFFYKQTKYKSSDGKEEYVKISIDEAEKLGLFFECSIKDLGEKINDSNLLYKNIFYYGDIKRDDPFLIRVVETLGKESNGSCSELEITEIPDGVEWDIHEYDGYESIHEVHRSW